MLPPPARWTTPPWPTSLPRAAHPGARRRPLLERSRAGRQRRLRRAVPRARSTAARRLAGILVGEQGADDLVSESFARVLAGCSPAAVPRRLSRLPPRYHPLRLPRRPPRRQGAAGVTDQPWRRDDVPPPAEVIARPRPGGPVTAFATLPGVVAAGPLAPRGRGPLAGRGRVHPRHVGRRRLLAGLPSPRGPAARLPRPAPPGCDRLASAAGRRAGCREYVRGDLSPRAQQKVADHLDECEECPGGPRHGRPGQPELRGVAVPGRPLGCR